MTTNVVTDDRKKSIKPTAEQSDIYNRRENELRTRFLKGILDIDGVLALLQKALELVKCFINCNVQPEIPPWADQGNPIISHTLRGVIDPSQLAASNVFADGENILDGEEYITRAQKLEGSMNACALDFYAKPENWKYLPKDVDVLVFPQTVFRNSGGNRCVRYLYSCFGSEWNQRCDWIGGKFVRRSRVAVLASPQVLGAKTS